jgi:hypothetical protein
MRRRAACWPEPRLRLPHVSFRDLSRWRRCDRAPREAPGARQRPPRPNVSGSGWRPGSKWPADLPFMTERIDDPAQAPAVLVGHVGCWRGAGADRLREHRIWIVGYQQDPARCTADCLRAEPRSVRSARGNPERGVSDRQLRDDLVSLPDAMQGSGAESCLIELDSGSSAIDPQFRLYTRHAGDGSRRLPDSRRVRRRLAAAGRDCTSLRDRWGGSRLTPCASFTKHRRRARHYSVGCPGQGIRRRRSSRGWWAWPLPPSGPLEFVCHWPTLGTGETRVGTDAQLILDTAGRSIRLWPEAEALPSAG